MNPRDTIAAILKVRDENVLPSEVDDNERDASADHILSALTAAGHRIVGPADMEAVEAAKDAYDASIEMQPREYHQAWFEAITAAAPHMPVPAGWVLVPEEPSQDIVDTLTLIIRRSVWGRDNVIKQWKELLSTSSRPKGGAHG